MFREANEKVERMLSAAGKRLLEINSSIGVHTGLFNYEDSKSTDTCHSWQQMSWLLNKQHPNLSFDFKWQNAAHRKCTLYLRDRKSQDASFRTLAHDVKTNADAFWKNFHIKDKEANIQQDEEPIKAIMDSPEDWLKRSREGSESTYLASSSETTCKHWSNNLDRFATMYPGFRFQHIWSNQNRNCRLVINATKH